MQFSANILPNNRFFCPKFRVGGNPGSPTDNDLNEFGRIVLSRVHGCFPGRGQVNNDVRIDNISCGWEGNHPMLQVLCYLGVSDLCVQRSWLPCAYLMSLTTSVILVWQCHSQSKDQKAGSSDKTYSSWSRGQGVHDGPIKITCSQWRHHTVAGLHG